MGTNIYALAALNNLALQSVAIMGWFRLPLNEKLQDFELRSEPRNKSALNFSRSPMNTSSMIFKEQNSTCLSPGKDRELCC